MNHSNSDPLQSFFCGSQTLSEIEIHTEWIRKNGTSIPIKLRVSTIPNQTQDWTHLLLISMDQLETEIQSRDRFFHVASHELQTPISALMLHVGVLNRIIELALLSSQDCQETLAQSLKIGTFIEKQAKSLSVLGRELLDVTQIAAGQLRLNKSRINLTIIASEIISRFQSDYTSNTTRISFSSSGNTMGNWDFLRLEQVVTNLISNAIKYSDGQPIYVDLTELDDKKWVCLTVKDLGPGVPPEQREKIFNRFERGRHDEPQGNRTNRIQGLGLGLYITRELVEAHNGKITVRDDNGKGAIFEVILPKELFNN